MSHRYCYTTQLPSGVPLTRALIPPAMLLQQHLYVQSGLHARLHSLRHATNSPLTHLPHLHSLFHTRAGCHQWAERSGDRAAEGAPTLLRATQGDSSRKSMYAYYVHRKLVCTPEALKNTQKKSGFINSQSPCRWFICHDSSDTFASSWLSISPHPHAYILIPSPSHTSHTLTRSHPHLSGSRKTPSNVGTARDSSRSEAEESQVCGHGYQHRASRVTRYRHNNKRGTRNKLHRREVCE